MVAIERTETHPVIGAYENPVRKRSERTWQCVLEKEPNRIVGFIFGVPSFPIFQCQHSVTLGQFPLCNQAGNEVGEFLFVVFHMAERRGVTLAFIRTSVITQSARGHDR
jgi:hypothetical protein